MIQIDMSASLASRTCRCHTSHASNRLCWTHSIHICTECRNAFRNQYLFTENKLVLQPLLLMVFLEERPSKVVCVTDAGSTHQHLALSDANGDAQTNRCIIVAKNRTSIFRDNTSMVTTERKMTNFAHQEGTNCI